jgi:hypothetical protein
MKKILTVRLNTETYNKLKLFSVEKCIDMSDIVRVLIDNSDMKVDNVRDIGNILMDVHKGIASRTRADVVMDTDMVNKLEKMKIVNNAPYSEIIRCLIKEADFNKFNFVEKDNSERTVEAWLDDNDYKRLKEFSIINFVTFHEIIEVLIKSSDIKVKNIRSMSELYKKAKVRAYSHCVPFYSSEELYIKLRKMRIENGATNCEIIRTLVKNCDLSKFKFKLKSHCYVKKEKAIVTERKSLIINLPIRSAHKLFFT